MLGFISFVGSTCGINSFCLIPLIIVAFINSVKSSKLLNFISNFDGWIFTSINDGSVSIYKTTIGYLESSL